MHFLFCLTDRTRDAVKHFPRWLPGIHGVKTFAEKSRQLCDELINHLFDGVKQDVVRL